VSAVTKSIDFGALRSEIDARIGAPHKQIALSSLRIFCSACGRSWPETATAGLNPKLASGTRPTQGRDCKTASVVPVYKIELICVAKLLEPGRAIRKWRNPITGWCCARTKAASIGFTRPLKLSSASPSRSRCSAAPTR
jgi:hypothetical protein